MLFRSPEVREYPDVADQIREILIHGNYMSQKDIEICLGFDLEPLKSEANFPAIEALHRSLCTSYPNSESVP